MANYYTLDILIESRNTPHIILLELFHAILRMHTFYCTCAQSFLLGHLEELMVTV